MDKRITQKVNLFQGAEGCLRDLLSKRKCAYPGYLQENPFFQIEGMGFVFSGEMPQARTKSRF